ncbi:MAG: hypothetical protein MZW92_55085 [Comamonadaceae bacterium]|nr:hypothetical protein [Comamonadaceae bacterium]
MRDALCAARPGASRSAAAGCTRRRCAPCSARIDRRARRRPCSTALAASDGVGAAWQVARAGRSARPTTTQALGELAGAAAAHGAGCRSLPDAVPAEGEPSPTICGAGRARCSPEDLQLLYQIAIRARRDLPLAPDARGGFEMALLRMLALPAGGAWRPPRPARAASAADRARLPRAAPHAPAAGVAPAVRCRRRAPGPGRSRLATWDGDASTQLDLGGMARAAGRALRAGCARRTIVVWPDGSTQTADIPPLQRAGCRQALARPSRQRRSACAITVGEVGGGDARATSGSTSERRQRPPVGRSTRPIERDPRCVRCADRPIRALDDVDRLGRALPVARTRS